MNQNEQKTEVGYNRVHFFSTALYIIDNLLKNILV